MCKKTWGRLRGGGADQKKKKKKKKINVRVWGQNDLQKYRPTSAK